MKVVVEKVDATRAQQLLDAAYKAGQKQRHLSEKRVQRYARAMENGQWHLTHQAIGIDKSGIMLDGQHRMAAVVRSDTVQEFLIAYDAEPETFDVIDTGGARTAADTLSIAGYSNVNQLSVAARMLMAYDVVKGTKQRLTAMTGTYTNADVLKFMDTRRGEILMEALHEAAVLANVFGRYGSKTWLAAAITLLMESDVHRDIAREFLSKLRTGEMLAAGSPILAMRRWMMSETGWAASGQNDRSTVGVAVFIKTLNQWLAKEYRQLSIYKAGIEFMPIITLPDGFLTMGSYGDDERTPLEIEESHAQELEEANARK